MITRTRLLAVFIATLNFLFFLVVSRNANYQFYFFTGRMVQFVQVPLLLLLMMKLSFSGFSLALFLFPWLVKHHAKITVPNLLMVLSYVVLTTAAINYVDAQNPLVVIALVFLAVFVPSFIFGLIYGCLIRDLSIEFHKTLFFLLVGSAIAIVIYNYAYVYLPFVIGYLGIFCGLWALLVWNQGLRFRAWGVLVALIPVMALIGKPHFGQVYTKSGIEENGELISSSTGPYGVLDVLHIRTSDDYLMLTDKQSPSRIAIKGDIEGVHEQAKIPYLIRRYDTSLIVGIGGGQDLVAGLHYGTKSITAVELDAQRIALMTGEFRDYSKHLLLDPRVNLVTDSGRAFLRRNRQAFDLISIQSPWTMQFINSTLYDTSRELFTEEALDAYLNALNKDGIIYWGLPLSIGGDVAATVLGPLIRRRNEKLKDHMLLFYPSENREYLSVVITKEYDLEAFHHSYKNVYEFVYYPSMEVARGQDVITDALFFDDRVKRVSTDKELFIWAKSEGRRQAAAVTMILLVLLTAWNKMKRNRIVDSMYFHLGIGYEIMATFLIVWLSSFSVNLVRLLPIVLIVYFLLGSIGYWHSGGADKRTIVMICALLASICVFIWSQNLFFAGRPLSAANVAVLIALFASLSYFITFPFGYLIRHEANIYRALAIDYLGSLCSLLIIWFLPHLDYLLFMVIFIYVLIGVLMVLSANRVVES